MLRAIVRRFLVALVAAILLWVGFGNPHHLTPLHQSESIRVDGLHLRAIRTGHGDTTLVFLHGYGESLIAWRLVLDRFRRHYRILAIDLPGFGLSDKPPGRYDYTTYERWLGDLIQRQTRGPLVLVGHSMGGQLAAGLALDHPDRVIALVLIAPAGAGISTLLTDSGGGVSPATQWVATALSYGLSAHDTAWLGEPAADLRYEPGADSLARTVARTVLEQFDFGAIAERYRDLQQPVLLIWGRQDPTIPFSIGEQIAAQLPCRRFVALLALHRPHQTLPDTVAAEMEQFLHRPGCGAR